MQLTLKGLVVTMSALMLFASLLAACGTLPQPSTGPQRILVGPCSQQSWPVTKRLTAVPSSSQSVYFIGGIHLYALDAGNGTLRWCRYVAYADHADTRLSTRANAAALLGMEGPPALPDGFTGLTESLGTIYACALNSYTYAFQSASGALLWRHATGFDNTSAPAVVDGVVYVGSGSIYALNAQNGLERWHYPTPDVVTSSPVIVKDVLYAGSHGDRVYALNAATGVLRWQYNTGGRVYVDPIVAFGTVFFGAGDDGPTLYAVNAQDGKLLWHNAMPIPAVPSSLAAANGMLFVGSRNFLYALHPRTGAILWRRPMATPFTPLIVNGVIYLASGSGGMYALNASDGTLRWHTPLNPLRAGLTTRPLLLKGEVYVETLDVGGSPLTAIIHALNASTGAEDWNASIPDNIGGTIGIAA